MQSVGPSGGVQSVEREEQVEFNEAMRLTGSVRGEVEILRDGAGVPHVFAGSTADLYFGLGLAMAQDRLWQMDRLRRRALGRQAEVLGPEYVRSDLTHLAAGVDVAAEADAARLSGAVREIVEAFVAGINCWIERCGEGGAGGVGDGASSAGTVGERAALPPEFGILGYAPERFSARDVVAILRGMWWSLNGRLEQIVAAEAARLLPDERLRASYLTPEAPEERIVSEATLPGGTPFPVPGSRRAALQGSGDATGSNNWAVSGARSVSGQAMLCSDPHQSFWLPGSWHEYALHGPEEEVAGAGHPGVPGVWFGMNGRIAWGITNNAASTRDLYVEEVHPDDPTLYRDGEGWARFETREVSIPVQGEPARKFTIWSTRRGPIMNEVLPSVAEGGDPPLALRWVGQEQLEDLESLIALGRARSWEEFREALRGWGVPAFNFGYADARGAVGYQCVGRVPVRGRVARGYRRADEPRDAWQGYVPFDELPRQEDPARGYIASANQRVAPDAFPHQLHGAWAAGHRGVRLRQALEPRPGRPRFERAQMVALQNDVKSCRAERLCPPLLDRLEEASGHDADVRLVCDALTGWDYRYTLEGTAPLVFEAVMQEWLARVAAERFPARLAPLVTAHGSAAAQLIEAPGTLAWFAGGTEAEQAALEEAARAAVARLRRELGDDPARWRWGAVHVAHWQHPLSAPERAETFDVGPASVDGGADCVRNTGTSPAFRATSGAEYRLVVDFSAPDRLWAVQNTGNSGVPGSPHYADQFPDWLAGEYHTVHLRREAVEAEAESRTVVVPAP